ncbi:HNH endonuclease signature motif containing protein [Mycobacterium decipiens]|uniref:HNH nuclease domain-containing protein n=1 Tax=Mycobacterium decipiens TaxID=1430326 RepID=A0A1X2LQT1_9MYCO|nr:HNH endonuclease signature motif containing protein [Mycobacterium decipiens]OSC38754.1 hypothetical protein B8W66_19365 [Mycobacterium decipiens]
MFDTVADAALVATIDASARAESAAAARRLAAIAELVARRADSPADRGRWSCDNWDAIAAEVAAAQNISHGVASGQMYLAVALRHRLPNVAALFAEGAISTRLASTIAWRTALITNPDAMRRVDTAVADDAEHYGPLSEARTARAIDAIIDRYDPAALRRTRAGARGRDVVITPDDNDSAIATLWGSLLATDGAVLDRRLSEMAGQICDDDPRTLAQRRADALGTLAAGGQRLACACQRADCPARPDTDPRAAAVVIHVVADATSLTAQPDPHTNGERSSRPITADMTLHEALAPDPEPPASWLPPAQIMGGATVPAPLLAQLVAAGAKVRRVASFTEVVPETGYRPSAQLARFIRCRDLTCRFPGCDRPAEYSDIDHTIPYPLGPTHPSNLKCLCRKHHLLKTFWDGPTGWRDHQHPDGTITWTSPSGHTYTTRPGSRLLFPALCLPTGELSTAATAQPQTQRGLMMPTRRRTRQQDRAYRINAERALNLEAAPRRA